MADRDQGFGHGCGNGGYGGDLRGEVTGEALREKTSVGNSSGIDARGIDGIGVFEIGDQGADEPDVIGAREGTGIVPVRVDALGIGNDEAAGVGELVESGEAGHVVIVASATVEYEEKRGGMVLGERLRNVEEIGSGPAVELDFAFEVVNIGAPTALAAGRLRGLRAGLCDGAGRLGEERTQ